MIGTGGGATKSAVYSGWVRHRRYTAAPHAFSYRLFMMYLDLDELPTLFDGRWLWSVDRPNIAWFRRADYLGPAARPLDESVRDLVEARSGWRPTGPIRLLTHLRYWGHCFNPVSFYYCFAPSGLKTEAIVAQINNTPWDERHAYVLTAAANQGSDQAQRYRFAKDFHVSPFMAMDQQYDWRFGLPGETLGVHMENWREGERLFDATLSLRRQPLDGMALARVLGRFPLVTLKVVGAIYWQALRLWAKGVPFCSHPQSSERPVACPAAKEEKV